MLHVQKFFFNDYVFETQCYRERERRDRISYLMIHFPNEHEVQSWACLKLGARNFWISCRGPSTWRSSVAFPCALSGNLIDHAAPRTQTGAHRNAGAAFSGFSYYATAPAPSLHTMYFKNNMLGPSVVA